MAFSSELFLQKVLNTPLDLKLEIFIFNSLKYSCLWMNCNRSKIIWYDILKLIYGLNFVIFYLYSHTLPEINLFNVSFNAIQPEKSCLADCYLIKLLQCSHSKALPSDSHRFFTYYVTQLMHVSSSLLHGCFQFTLNYSQVFLPQHSICSYQRISCWIMRSSIAKLMPTLWPRSASEAISIYI